MALNQSEFVEKLWNSPEEMQKFIASPKKYLQDQGESVPENVTVHAHVDTLSVRNFVLPVDKSQLPEGDNPVLTITRQAMDDSAFKDKLLSDPKAAAAEEGLNIPDGVVVNVFQNTADQVHVVVPFNPAKAELSDADLEAVAGGKNETAKAACLIGGGIQAGICGTAAFFTAGATAIASVVTGTVATGAASAAGTYG